MHPRLDAYSAPLSRTRAPTLERDPWAFLRAFFEHAPQAISVLDASLRIAVWNAAASAITGHLASETLNGRCRLEGSGLTLDLAPGIQAPHMPTTRPDDLSLRAVRIRTKTGQITTPNLVAAIVPLHGHDASFLLHLCRTVSSVPQPVAAPSSPLPPGSPAEPGALHASRPLDVLTTRESEILRLLAAGKTAKPIACELSLSLATVRTHLQHILRKLGVHSCLEAVVCFLRADPDHAEAPPASAPADGCRRCSPAGHTPGIR